ncbi:hypothetical protein D9619_006406 [Psilocybe cf. subviscida]|uniref:Aminoglycoside phosphotransferase domain-containing protein n=1 Tax=Psilocybe cf. subviscida TaxID=2480587 RepID=A0A8H5EXV5_9AGAR|nr:hypothetical protein D9619_006406 [Psilocybe cf. subviscida]
MYLTDILDALFTIFYPAKKPQVSLKPSDVDSLSDEEIEELMTTASRFIDGVPGTVAKLIHNWLGKDTVDCSEANVSQIVFKKTTIPIPRVRRVIKSKGIYIIVMDYIQDSNLAEVWPTYSLWQKIRVAFTLRRYVRQLRWVEAPLGTLPGPLSEQGPQACDVSSIFGRIRPRRGPFNSYKELSDFFNYRYGLGWKAILPEDHPIMKATFDDSSPLVITHNDLNPRNIIVGEDGRIWVVNWAWSGYYPPWFEYSAMTNQVENEQLGGWYDRSWELAIPFVCGPNFQQHEWLGRAGLGLDYT